MTVEASGTQTATISTEHTLNAGSFTSAKTYVLTVDLSNLANGDTVELRVKKKVLTGGTEKQIYLGTYSHAQLHAVVDSIPVRSEYSVSFTLKQTAGTGRNFDWAVLSL